MDNFPINKAHQLDRTAEHYLKQKKFDDSILCYQNAMKHLYDALEMTENAIAKESIQLQIDAHQKQIDHLKIKKTQWEDYRTHQEALRQRLANYVTICDNVSYSLQNEIFQTMDNHDSLVLGLLKRDEDSLQSYSNSDTDEKTSDQCDGKMFTGKKRQVDDAVIMEELKFTSEKLKELIQILIVQLEDKDNEINRLKAEINRLESEKTINKGTGKANNTLKVITDSSGGTSPYVFSPCSELSPEIDVTSLPVLAPLEMPSFDFSKLTLKDSTMAATTNNANDSNNTNNN